MSGKTARVAILRRTGGAEVIELVEAEVPEPGPGEVRIAVDAIGLNRSEALFREGWHPTKPNLPSRIGYEAAGRIDAVGSGVTGFAPGDRVSTLPTMTLNACGAYGEMLNAPANLVVHSPPELPDEQVAALWSSYMTAYGMVVDLVDIARDDWAIVTAASSSVGPPAIQMLKMVGAKVIATTRGHDKVDAIRAMGADQVIVTDQEDLAARVVEITGGRGAAFAFDPVGGPLVDALARSIRPYGTIVLYGVLDFAPTPLPLQSLIGNNLVIRGYAMLLEDRPGRNERAIAFIREGVRTGELRPLIGKRFPLSEIREACAYLDSMQQIGKVVVLPEAVA